MTQSNPPAATRAHFHLSIFICLLATFLEACGSLDGIKSISANVTKVFSEPNSTSDHPDSNVTTAPASALSPQDSSAEEPAELETDVLAKRLPFRADLFPPRIVWDGMRKGERIQAEHITKQFDQRRVFAEQSNPQWCWAACAQMVNAFHNIRIFKNKGHDKIDATQADLAGYFNGSRSEQSADYITIMRAIRPDCESKIDQGKVSGAALSLIGMTSDRLVASITKDRSPAIVGLDFDGYLHACVVTGVTYSVRDRRMGQAANAFLNPIIKDKLGSGDSAVNKTALDLGKLFMEHPEFSKQGTRFIESWSSYTRDQYIIENITGFDPQPENGNGRFEMSGEDLALRCKFLITRSLAGEMLLAKERSITLQEFTDMCAKEFR